MTDISTPDGKNDAEAMKYAQKYKQVDPLAGLPAFVKEPKNYMKIEKALLETLSCGKSHSDPVEMMKCSTCTENMKKRRRLMKEFGFKSVEQYFAWRKVHAEIRKMMPLVDWDKEDKGTIVV